MSEAKSEVVENEVDESELLARETFDDCAASGKSEDEIKIALVQDAGCAFSAATRLYNQFMVDTGQVMGKADRDGVVEKVCSGQDLSDEAVFGGVCADIANEVTGSSEKNAGTWVRAWAKKAEVDVFKKAAGEGRTSGFRYAFYQFLKGKPQSTKDEAITFITENGTENDKRNHPHYLAILDLVNTVSA